MDLPFAFEKISAGRSIIGREDQIAKAVSIITGSQKGISVYDTPRSGKETFVREVISRLKAQSGTYFFCEIDLFNTRSSEDFITLFRNAMQDCYHNANKNTILPFDIDFDSLTGRKVLELPEVLAQEIGMTLVLYIKEFQNVATFDDDKELKVDTIDKVWSKHKSVRYILTGSSLNTMKHLFEEKRYFYSITSNINLAPLERKTVCEYISSTFLNTGRVIESEEALEIYSITGGNMWYVKQMCALCYAFPAGYINRTVVNQAKEQLLSIHSANFMRVMFDLTSNQINLLRALVNGVERFSSAEILERYKLNSSANVFRIKEALVKKEVITFDEDDRAHIQDPFFGYWLRNYYFSE